MTCEHCEQKGFTYTEQYRHECEVRYICILPTLNIRRSLLQVIEEKRGLKAVEKIKEDMVKFWKNKK